MNWIEELNQATDRWSCTYDGVPEESEALLEVQRVVRKINQTFGSNLIMPDQRHMEEINRSIGDVEPTTRIEDLEVIWNELTNNTMDYMAEQNLANAAANKEWESVLKALDTAASDAGHTYFSLVCVNRVADPVVHLLVLPLIEKANELHKQIAQVRDAMQQLDNDNTYHPSDKQ